MDPKNGAENGPEKWTENCPEFAPGFKNIIKIRTVTKIVRFRSGVGSESSITIFDLNYEIRSKVTDGENQAYHDYLERDFAKCICHMTYHVIMDR